MLKELADGAVVSQVGLPTPTSGSSQHIPPTPGGSNTSGLQAQLHSHNFNPEKQKQNTNWCWSRGHSSVVEHLASMWEAPCVHPQHHVRLGMMIHAYNASTWEVEEEGLGAQGHSQLHREFQAGLGYEGFCFHQEHMRLRKSVCKLCSRLAPALIHVHVATCAQLEAIKRLCSR